MPMCAGPATGLHEPPGQAQSDGRFLLRDAVDAATAAEQIPERNGYDRSTGVGAAQG
jgi:hypothetical protein